MKGRIVRGPERAQADAKRAVRTMRKRVFEGDVQPRTVTERAVRVVEATMRVREPEPWWRRLWAWLRRRRW